MAIAEYPTQNIHLPPHKTAVRTAEITSLTGGALMLAVTLALFVDRIFVLNMMGYFLGETLINYPTIIALLACSFVLFLYKKDNKSRLAGLPLQLYIALLGIIVTAIGVFTVLDNVQDVGLVQYASAVDFKAGIMLLLIGFAVITTTIHLPHRYHYMQAILSITILVSLFSFLASMYHLVSNFSVAGQTTVWASLLFLLLCTAFMLARPNRGFVGLFTTDTHMSQLSRILLVYFALMPPLFGLLFILMEKLGFFDFYSRLALIVALFIVSSVILTWISVRLLYHSEVEHYLLKEAMRVNNISLELNAYDLSSQVDKLEQAKKAVADKLNQQQTLKDVIEQYD
jgi:hypothetical protein